MFRYDIYGHYVQRPVNNFYFSLQQGRTFVIEERPLPDHEYSDTDGDDWFHYNFTKAFQWYTQARATNVSQLGTRQQSFEDIQASREKEALEYEKKRKVYIIHLAFKLAMAAATNNFLLVVLFCTANGEGRRGENERT